MLGCLMVVTAAVFAAQGGEVALWDFEGGVAGDSFTAALLTLFFPKMVEAFSPSIVFGFFCFMMVLQLAWVKFFVPETKGVALEDMQKKLGIN